MNLHQDTFLRRDIRYALIPIIFAAVADGQTRADIPKCAVPCWDAAVGNWTGCDVEDYECACEREHDIRETGARCVINACGNDAGVRDDVLPAWNEICRAVRDKPATSSTRKASSGGFATESTVTNPEPATTSTQSPTTESVNTKSSEPITSIASATSTSVSSIPPPAESGSGDGTQSTKVHEGTDNRGVIIGAAVGAVAGLIILLLGLWFWYKRRQKRTKQQWPFDKAQLHSDCLPKPVIVELPSNSLQELHGDSGMGNRIEKPANEPPASELPS